MAKSRYQPLLTPYSQAIRQRQPNGELNGIINNVDPYLLFVLHTRLVPLVKILLGLDVLIDMPTIRTEDDRLTHIVSVRRYEEAPREEKGSMKVLRPIVLTQYQHDQLESAIRTIVEQPRHALLYDANYLDHRYPQRWARNILPFVVSFLPIEISPIMTPAGILAEMGINEDYLDQYHRFSSWIIATLAQWYKQGVSVVSTEVAEKWELDIMARFSNGGMVLGLPTWCDGRFGNCADLLSSLDSTGRGTIWLNITALEPDEILAIQNYLPGSEIRGHQLGFSATSLDYARSVTSYVYGSH